MAGAEEELQWRVVAASDLVGLDAGDHHHRLQSSGGGGGGAAAAVVGVVTLNRPQTRNALTPGLLRAITAAVNRAANDPQVKIINTSPFKLIFIFDIFDILSFYYFIF